VVPTAPRTWAFEAGYKELHRNRSKSVKESCSERRAARLRRLHIAKQTDGGEARLIETVGPARELPPRDLIARIMQDADAFAAGAPQHDDMTVVVLKYADSGL
jgi:hypothetical protein